MRKGLTSGTVLRDLAHKLLPEAMYRRGKQLFLSREAGKLRDLCASESSLDRVVDHVLASERFRPDQKKTEIVQLLEELRRLRPTLLCEIGGRMGGSLALFARVAASDARILSIDLDYKPGQGEGLAGFAGARQKINCVAADSHAPATFSLVTDWLGGQLLDFLFIDGDHTLEGAKNDFVMYSPLVRSGGLIAFHDIVPDSTMRFGVKTASYVGEVPILWKQLRGHGLKTQEFVESWDQDGFGIGIIRWDGDSLPGRER